MKNPRNESNNTYGSCGENSSKKTKVEESNNICNNTFQEMVTQQHIDSSSSSSSASTAEQDTSKKNIEPTRITLYPTEYYQWTKEQVASLLCAPDEVGGAGLSFEEVKPLYYAKFKGNSIHNIMFVSKEKDKHFAIEFACKDYSPDVSHSTIKSVVFWVDKLIKTRLYHLWSTDQVKEKLGHPIDDGGAGLSSDSIERIVKNINLDGKRLGKLIKDIRKEENHQVIEQFKMLIQEHTNIDDSIKVVEWVKNIITCTPLKVALTFRNTQFDLPQFNDLSYQNNKNTIKKMSETLLDNIKLHRKKEAIRYQTLLICSAYFGSGKTRLGAEFLSQFELQMKDENWRGELEKKYSQYEIKQLSQSKVVYVDCRNVKIIGNDLSKTFELLKIEIDSYLSCKIENTPCFIILDEVGFLAETYKPISIQNVHPHFSSLNSVLQDFVLRFQKIPSVSLYVCGKGAYMDIVGDGRIRPTFQSPTIINRILLESFSKKDIETILKNTNHTSSLVTHLEKNRLFDYFIDQVYEETRGVPYFVVHYILQENYLQCLLKENVEDRILDIRKRLPTTFLAPYQEFSNQPMLMEIYHSLLFAGIVGMEIDNSKFRVLSIFPQLENIKEFEGIVAINMLDIGSILNCYLQPVGKKFKLLFPKAIIEEYLTTYLSSKACHGISWLVDEYSSVMSEGDAPEHLTRALLQFNITWGAAQNSQIGEVLPFLNKTSVAQTSCYKLETINLIEDTKLNKKSWENVIKKLEGSRKLGYFYDGSYSPDEIWNVPNTNMETYILIQDKISVQSQSFKEEVEKNEKVRKVVGDEVKLIMLFMSRFGSFLAGTYNGGDDVGGVKLQKNTTVVILSTEDATQFYGNSNLEALKRLSVSHKK